MRVIVVYVTSLGAKLRAANPFAIVEALSMDIFESLLYRPGAVAHAQQLNVPRTPFFVPKRGPGLPLQKAIFWPRDVDFANLRHETYAYF